MIVDGIEYSCPMGGDDMYTRVMFELLDDEDPSHDATWTMMFDDTELCYNCWMETESVRRLVYCKFHTGYIGRAV